MAVLPDPWRRSGASRAGLLAVLLALIALSTPAAAAASHVYVTGSGATGNAVSPFSVGSNGSLTPISCGSSCATGTAPIGVAMTPNGQYLYTANALANSISAFSVGSNGSLTTVSCSGCTTGSTPYGVAITPSGQYLYTANLAGNSISVFSIGAGGALTPVSCSGANCSTGTKPYGVAVTPNGQYLYSANNNSNSVSAFSIGSSGALTPISCSGSNCTTGSQPEGIAVSPDGQYLYTANRGASTGSVSVFSIGSNGSLTALSCGSGCNLGTAGAFSLAISSDGSHLYVTVRNAAARVAVFAIGTNGLLTPVACSGSNCTTGTNPGGVAVTPDSLDAYASVFSTNAVIPYSIGSSGALTPITCTSPSCNTAAGPDFQSVVVSPDQAPTAAFGATAARPGQASSFNGSASTASAGQTVARYDWNYGDGQNASNAGPTPTHTYSAEGDYIATLTVTDDAGCSTSRTFTGQTVSCNGSSVATVSHTVSVDGTPPNTLIDSAPHGMTTESSPSFDFHATESGSSFECSIDTGSADWGPCSGSGTHSPSSPLAEGGYTFRVRATDAQGNTDQTAASESFSVATAVVDTDTSCPPVAVTVGNYTPSPNAFAATAAGELGPTVPGVRARITITEPSRLLIGARLRWVRNGLGRSVDLGARSLGSPGTRNIRLGLPASLADDLPRGTPVTLKLRVTARPTSAPGCTDASLERLSLQTQVIRVLASSPHLHVRPSAVDRHQKPQRQA